MFYDYDEVSLITDLNFRRVPAARSEEEEFADQPWYPVERGDVFPEHFPRFIDLSPGHRELFAQAHGDLFEPDWWRELQASLRQNPAGDVRPYPGSARLVQAH